MRLRLLLILTLLVFASPAVIAAQDSLEDVCASRAGDTEVNVEGDFTAEELQAQLMVVAGFNSLELSPEVALTMFEQAIEADDSYADSYLGRGCVYLAQGDTDQAAAEFEQFIALTEDADAADTVAGLLGGSSTTGASDECVLVTSIPPVFDSQADAQDFIDTFNEGIKTPDYLQRSDAYLCVGDIDSAIVDLTTLIAQDPDHAEGYAARGILYRRLQEYDLAMDDFNAALSIEPDYVSALNGRAYTQYLLGEYEQCIEDYNVSIALEDRDAIAYGNLGLCYSGLNDEETAIEHYNLALEIEPDNAIIIGNRALSYRLLEAYDLAMEDNNRAIEIDPEDPFYYVERGLVFYALDDFNSAIEDFTQAIELDPNDTAAWLNLGDAQRELNNRSAAIEAYERYLELYPDSPYAEELEDYIGGK